MLHCQEWWCLIFVRHCINSHLSVRMICRTRAGGTGADGPVRSTRTLGKLRGSANTLPRLLVPRPGARQASPSDPREDERFEAVVVAGRPNASSHFQPCVGMTRSWSTLALFFGVG